MNGNDEEYIAQAWEKERVRIAAENRVKKMRAFLEELRDEFAECQPWEFTAVEIAEQLGTTPKRVRWYLAKKIEEGTIKERIGKQNKKYYSLIERNE